MDASREKELLERCRKDPRAFGEFYDANFEAIFRYIVHRVANVAIAEDLTSKTFEKALKKIGGFRWQGVSVTAWLYRVASNEVNSYLRQQYRLRKNENPWVENVTAVDNRSPDLEMTYAETQLAKHELFVVVNKHLRRLGRKDQTILTLRYFEDKSYREIAEIVGSREGALRMRASRALAKLRGYLAEESIGDEQYREATAGDIGAEHRSAAVSASTSEPTY